MSIASSVRRPIGCLVAAVFSLAIGCGEPASESKPTPTSGGTPPAPLIEKTQLADWCAEHGVPESICTRCNKELIAGFKQKGDWCKKHDLPDSQCFVCHPELEAKFKAMAPKGK